MSNMPSVEKLEKALTEAGSAHHEYEVVTLGGIYDQLWPGFYAAYVLGKLGNFATPSVLSKLLEDAPESDDWAKSTAQYLVGKL